MKLIPILFSTPMVQAILEGRKTQTRRIAALPNWEHFGTNIMDWGLSKHPYQEEGVWRYHVQAEVDSYKSYTLKDKYGKVGDVLWVRETWLQGCSWDGNGELPPLHYYYKADGIAQKMDWYDPSRNDGLRPGGPAWKPSIHMPYAACRLWLKITDIRVERLQEISEEDARAEGVKIHLAETMGYPIATPKNKFKELWQSINGEEAWDSNPFVWAITFERTEKP